MILGTADGITLACATVMAAGLTVGLPLWYSSRKGRKKLSDQIGTPKANGSIAGDLHEFKGEVRERFRSGDQRFNRLDRANSELSDGQANIAAAVERVTAVVAQLSVKVDELNDLHRTPVTD